MCRKTSRPRDGTCRHSSDYELPAIDFHMRDYITIPFDIGQESDKSQSATINLRTDPPNGKPSRLGIRQLERARLVDCKRRRKTHVGDESDGRIRRTLHLDCRFARDCARDGDRSRLRRIREYRVAGLKRERGERRLGADRLGAPAYDSPAALSSAIGTVSVLPEFTT